MDLSYGHFYKTIEETKTAIKQYSKVHYFIRLIRRRRIKKNFNRWESPRRIKIFFIHRELSSMNKNNCIRWESSRDE